MTSKKAAGQRHKQRGVSFPEEVLAEIRAEAKRQDRPLSWLLVRAWRIARERIMATPSMPEPPK